MVCCQGANQPDILAPFFVSRTFCGSMRATLLRKIMKGAAGCRIPVVRLVWDQVDPVRFWAPRLLQGDVGKI